ncbi:putative holin [Acidovorax sp. BLS4]|uniref:putative holin n=1 Tax=Acidovorax sp. BLS4 TaxID=3273430 RepID=UPI002943C6F1|nr:putative holin [Paracidovorax avenae]WOI46989.1 putative holin [Paracidovorax avenae]
MKDVIPLWLRAPRNSLFLLLAVLLLALITLVSPAQLPVVLYKAALIALAAVLGYWLDRVLFPYARPDGFLFQDWRLGTDEPLGDVDYPVVPGYQHVYIAAMVRRAIVVGFVVLGVAAGL